MEKNKARKRKGVFMGRGVRILGRMEEEALLRGCSDLRNGKPELWRESCPGSYRGPELAALLAYSCTLRARIWRKRQGRRWLCVKEGHFEMPNHYGGCFSVREGCYWQTVSG